MRVAALPTGNCQPRTENLARPECSGAADPLHSYKMKRDLHDSTYPLFPPGPKPAYLWARNVDLPKSRHMVVHAPARGTSTMVVAPVQPWQAGATAHLPHISTRFTFPWTPRKAKHREWYRSTGRTRGSWTLLMHSSFEEKSLALARLILTIGGEAATPAEQSRLIRLAGSLAGPSEGSPGGAADSPPRKRVKSQQKTSPNV
jgi:hypothetical protein